MSENPDVLINNLKILTRQESQKILTKNSVNKRFKLFTICEKNTDWKKILIVEVFSEQYRKICVSVGLRSKVLLDTAKGRKRKLSCYKSRNARKRKNENIEIIEENMSSASSSESSEEETNTNLIPTRVEEASDSDVLVEVKHGESSISEKDYETLSQILSDSEIEEAQSMTMDESENTYVSLQLRM